MLLANLGLNLNSALLIGDVRHHRLAIKAHSFNYQLYMMWVDLNAPQQLDGVHPWLGTTGFKALKFKQSDYLNRDLDTQQPIKQRAIDKIVELGITAPFSNVYMLGQLRCFGVYFSPVNFFFYETADGDFPYMVAEVSNTPWNERHYYLVDLHKKVNFKKAFSVSPFMNLDMDYHWKVRLTKHNTMIHIENKKDNTLLFTASLRLQRQSLSRAAVTALLKRFPAMTITVMKGIYVQAFKLFCKRVPFLGHSGKN
ncbi:MAG: DUF1365 family protein [Pseudoalteromonas rhizosphaerae]|jgi:DUF1365 family protein